MSRISILLLELGRAYGSGAAISLSERKEMMMNQTESFLNFIQFNHGTVTLGEIMKTHFGCEYRRMFTELRKKGWTVNVELDRKQPSNNRYLLIPPMQFEPNGQRRFA